MIKLELFKKILKNIDGSDAFKQIAPGKEGEEPLMLNEVLGNIIAGDVQSSDKLKSKIIGVKIYKGEDEIDMADLKFIEERLTAVDKNPNSNITPIVIGQIIEVIDEAKEVSKESKKK